MDLLRETPGDHYDLAIVDPPYGIGMTSVDWGSSLHKPKNWDNEPPPAEYFQQLQRVSKNQVIWGGNYFLDHLASTRCMLVWNKRNGRTKMADCELAWTSFRTSVRMFSHHIFTGIGNMNYHPIHPTQKPVALYRWILDKYAVPGFRVLDTHLGSGSSAIAAHYHGSYLTGIELDDEYYRDACLRIERETQQLELGL